MLHLYGWAASQHQLYANIDAVRTLVCDEVQSSKEKYAAFLTNCDDMFLQFSAIDSWIAGMKQKHTFGDKIALGAFTLLYGTDVAI